MDTHRLKWALKEAATLFLKVLIVLAALGLFLRLVTRAIESDVVRGVVLGTLALAGFFVWVVWLFYHMKSMGPDEDSSSNQHTP